MRLRLETVKKIRAMGAKRKAKKDHKEDAKVTVHTGNDIVEESQPGIVKTRAPKVKKATLAEPPVAKAKFRKRQVHKSWLPTHLFHTKRARMTPPSEPLWRFAIPMTPTAKSYRPTHRAASERGALCWDVSYMSTISLDGREASIVGMLKQLGAGETDQTVWGAKGQKWRDGKRVKEFLFHERETPHAPIAPVTVIWCAPDLVETEEKRKRQAILRVHPSAFLQLWEEVLRVAKIAKPAEHALLSMQRDVGKTFRVLIEGDSKKSNEAWAGRNDQNKIIVFPKGSDALQKGDYALVHVHDCTSATLLGTLVSH